MLCAELVGRDVEIGSLRAAVDGAADGSGRLVALVGEAGTGKSRLLVEVGAMARTAGMAVLAGRAVPSSSPVPFRPLTEAFLAAFRGSPPPDDPSLVGLHGQLHRLVPLWAPSDEMGDESPVLLGEAAVRLLAVLARRGAGALLLLEDLHWSDPETLAVVEYLADALPSERVLCCFTARPTGAASDLVERLDRRRAGAVTVVPPLPADDVDRMVAACLATTDPPPVVGAFARDHSDGVPFLVEELLAGLVAAGELRFEDGRWASAGTLTPAVPASLRDSIRSRLDAFDRDARRVLAAAALLGRHFEWELLPGIAEVDGRATVDALRAAVDEQLIEVDGPGFTFRHALTREAVLADLLPPERSGLAARAWPAVERANPGLPGPVCELAAELAEAAGDRAAAATRLIESARRALANGAVATAEATARRAVALAAGDEPILLDADDLLVRVLVAAGKPADALAAGRDLSTRLRAFGAPPGRQVDLLLTTARAAITAGDLASASADVAAARALEVADTDPALSARIDAIAAHVALDSADVAEASRLAGLARDGAVATGQPDVECDALIVLGRIARTTDAVKRVALFERAAAVAAAAGLGRWHLAAQQELTMEVLPSGDSSRLAETRALAVRYGALTTVAFMDLIEADACLSAFDRERCLAAATACVDASRRYGLSMRSVAHLWLAGAHALDGNDEAMAAAIEEALAADPDDPRILADLYGRVLPTRALVRGDLESLPELLETMIGHVRRAPPTTSVYPGRILWALLHTVDDDDLGVGPRAEFDDAVAMYGMEPFVLASEFIAAVADGRTGRREEASTRFEAAYARLTGSTWIRGTTHACVLLAARAATRDGWGDPVRWLRASEAFFAERGYDHLVRRCRALLGEAGAPVPRRGRGDSTVPESLRARGVTSREVDVLKLVVAGRTNRDIAAELFLSPKTVEHHVASLFDRLGVRDRRALAALAAAELGERTS